MTNRLICALALVSAVACGDGGQAGWAVQSGSLVSEPNVATGFQVWEFYEDGWEEKGDDDKYYLCSRVQSISATEVDSLEGCRDCAVTYALTVTELETDCEEPWASANEYAGVTHFAFGLVAPSLETEDPHPGNSLGWYLSWDGVELEPFGFAWDEELDLSGETDVSSWTENVRFVFEPSFAWDI